MKYLRKQDLVFNDIDGEVVLLNVKTGKYFGMDAIGSRIWQLIDEPKTLAELVQTLTKEYDVSESQCSKDTEVFLNRLADDELLEAHEALA